jgi:hypothetical protein
MLPNTEHDSLGSEPPGRTAHCDATCSPQHPPPRSVAQRMAGEALLSPVYSKLWMYPSGHPQADTSRMPVVSQQPSPRSRRHIGGMSGRADERTNRVAATRGLKLRAAVCEHAPERAAVAARVPSDATAASAADIFRAKRRALANRRDVVTPALRHSPLSTVDAGHISHTL